MITKLSLRLVRVGADRWPATTSDDLRREWTAEVRTIARNPGLSAFARARLMLRFSASLALSSPERLGWRRVGGIVAAVATFLAVLTLIQRGWSEVFGAMAEGERWIIDDAGLGARLVQGAVALVPVLFAALLGRWLGRRVPAGPGALGLCLIAVVAAWVGAAFVLGRPHLTLAVPLPPKMGYGYGNQPYGMVTSWVVWLVAFVLVASVVRGLVGRLLGVIAVAGAATVAGTLVQFGPVAAAQSPLWLVPPHPYRQSGDVGAYSFHSARNVWEFVSSYPHVLLAIAAFGFAFLAARRAAQSQPAPSQPALANGLGIESSSNRV